VVSSAALKAKKEKREGRKKGLFTSKKDQKEGEQGRGALRKKRNRYKYAAKKGS